MNEPNNQSYLSDSDQSDDESSMPIGMGDVSSGPDLAGLQHETPKHRITSGALLIVIVVAIAATGLYSMRTVTRATAFTGGNQEIEQSIESFLKVIGSSDESTTSSAVDSIGNEAVLRVLTESYVERQVPVEGVQRNPFIILNEDVVAPPTGVRDDAGARLERQRRERQAVFEKAAGRLQLRTVLLGSTPLANVNNKIVRVGESITVLPEDVEFHVASISADSVTLLAEDPSLDLVLEFGLNLRPTNP